MPAQQAEPKGHDKIKRVRAMSERFLEFYSIYPRKVGRLDAEKAFHQMSARYDENDIIEGAKKFARAMAAEGKDKQFIPYPATWLRAGRWMDEEQETIKPEPIMRPVRTVEEIKAYLADIGKALSPEIARAKSVEDLPVFARMVPANWRAS